VCSFLYCPVVSFLFKSKYFPQHSVLEHSQSMPFSQCGRLSTKSIQNIRQNYGFVYFNIYIFGWQTGRQVSELYSSRCTADLCASNVFINAIFIGLYHFQIFELCYIVQGFYMVADEILSIMYSRAPN
jgi:hypothetical protein